MGEFLSCPVIAQRCTVCCGINAFPRDDARMFLGASKALALVQTSEHQHGVHRNHRVSFRASICYRCHPHRTYRLRT